MCTPNHPTTSNSLTSSNPSTTTESCGDSFTTRNGRPIFQSLLSINSLYISLSMLGIVFLLTLGEIQTTNGQQPVSAALNSIGMWEEDIGYYQSLRVSTDSPILRIVSKYQSIEVHVSTYYGKILMLDNVVQLTERDADSYNEMMAHMPMMQHENPKRALIIGGGDGYILSELLKHSSLQHVDHVDLDMEVIEVCKKHFSWGAAWDDPRVTLHISDGAAFVQKATTGYYDVIVQDSSDPWTYNDEGAVIPLPSAVLYTQEHFEQLYRILGTNGILNLQSETFNIPSDLDGIVIWRSDLLKVGFQNARYGSINIASYPTGQIGFLMCEKNVGSSSSMDHVKSRFAIMESNHRATTYYQPKLQQSSFDLPLWVERKIYSSVDDNSTSHHEEL